MNGVVKEIDVSISHLDAVLSNGRLKRSVRRELETMRCELLNIREEAIKLRRFGTAGWLLQLMSFVARVSELVAKHHH